MSKCNLSFLVYYSTLYFASVPAPWQRHTSGKEPFPSLPHTLFPYSTVNIQEWKVEGRLWGGWGSVVVVGGDSLVLLRLCCLATSSDRSRLAAPPPRQAGRVITADIIPQEALLQGETWVRKICFDPKGGQRKGLSRKYPKTRVVTVLPKDDGGDRVAVVKSRLRRNTADYCCAWKFSKI